mgnify:CR=1 FL=1
MMFGAYGQTLFSKDGEQVPELQQPWLVLYLREIQRHGIDPRDVEIRMSGGQRVYPFVTDEGGWNWSMEYNDYVHKVRSRPLPELP